MGGFLFLVPVFLITVVLNLANLLSGVEWGKRILRRFQLRRGQPLIGKSILLPLLTLIGFSLLGARDDWAGIHGKRSDGQGLLRGSRRLTRCCWRWRRRSACTSSWTSTASRIPGIAQPIDLGLIYIPIAVFVIVAMSNAVNLTDGLDGLAGSTSAVAFAALRHHRQPAGPVPAQFVLLRDGRRACSRSCGTTRTPPSSSWATPGALALGATLAVVALMTGQWLLLPVVGLVFVAEAASDVLQVS